MFTKEKMTTMNKRKLKSEEVQTSQKFRSFWVQYA